MNLSDDQKMIRETASSIATQELAPRSAEVDRKQTFPRDGLRKLAEAGFLGITVPETMGGGGGRYPLLRAGYGRNCQRMCFDSCNIRYPRSSSQSSGYCR